MHDAPLGAEKPVLRRARPTFLDPLTRPGTRLPRAFSTDPRALRSKALPRDGGFLICRIN